MRASEAWRTLPSGFIGSVAVVVIAVIARFGWISSPDGLVFDETFYQRDAYSMLVAGYELQWPEDGQPQNLYLDKPAFSAHPPLGKWVIAFFMNMVGPVPGGFRVGSAVCGTLLVVAVMVAVFLLIGRLIWANLAGLLLALDGLAVGTARIAMLDVILTTFIVVGFVFTLLHFRYRSRGGPFRFVRSWLLPAGLFFGLATATKWSGIAFIVGFTLITIAFELGFVKALGTAAATVSSRIRNSLGLVFLIWVPALIAYLTSWVGWFSGLYSYGSYLSDYPNPSLPAFLAWLPLEWHPFLLHHIDIATGVTSLATQHYALSPAAEWPLMLNPSLFAFNQMPAGSSGCDLPVDCVVSWSTVSNPLVWYPAIAATLFLVWQFARKRSVWDASILAGIAAGFVPWLFIQRDQFFYYAIAILPFLIMALVVMASMIVSASARLSRRKLIRGAVVGYFGAAILCALFFIPLALHTTMPEWFWNLHIWLPGWGESGFEHITN